MNKLAIMIPTYNEKDNIEKLVREIFKVADTSSLEVSIVVVDDNSPDGTGQILEDLKKEFDGRMYVMHRTHERGRGTAGIAGFTRCLELDVDYIMEMDADFSHDPKYIPLFADFSKHYDVVIGSRYVEGGTVVGWSFNRSIISAFANSIYRLILGTKIHDLSGGYKCYSKKVIESMDFDVFFSKGYSVGVETLFRCYKKDFSFIEIPVVFHNRSKGKSKFSLKEGIVAIFVICRLVLKFGRAIRFYNKN